MAWPIASSETGPPAQTPAVNVHETYLGRTRAWFAHIGKTLGIVAIPRVFVFSFVTPGRLELPTLRLEVTCSIQLSYGAKPHPS